MAATAAVNRPSPAHPGPNGGNLHTRATSSGPTSQQPDPALHGTGQDPGPSSHPHHHVAARPVFYVPAPPPPPYLHYQWPMPFSYNPFAGFPGMGYGMVMPPFPPPPPYMEAPAYILPHPHLQPVDYRRLLHPQVHAASTLYQNPNQTRRVRPPHTGPVRETVNSEVQTEPTQEGVGGYSEGSSDSGRGTASNSPSPLSSSSQKRGSAEVGNYTLPGSDVNDTEVKRSSTSTSVSHGFNVLHPTGTKAVQSCIRATLETQKHRKDGAGLENGRCNMWSVSSQDSMVPVCSSSQREEEVVRERRISVPDILMSWGTPQTAVPQSDGQLPSYETEAEHKSLYPSPTESRKRPVVGDIAYADNDTEGHLSSKDSATLFKILKLRESRRENEPVGLVGSPEQCPPFRDELLHSLNASHKLPDDEQESVNETNPHEDTMDTIPYQMSLNQMKRKMNESIWSVESLVPFVPKEWLLQNSTFEREVILERMEEDENEDLIIKARNESRQTRRRSSSGSAPMSDSWLGFSTPAEKRTLPKKPEMESEADGSEMRPKQVQSVAPSEKNPSASPTHLPQSEIVLSTQIEDKNGSSEPEANPSPNQESVVLNEQQEEIPCSPEREETLPTNSAAENVPSAGQLALQNGDKAEDGTCVDKEVKNKLCVPVADQNLAEISPSKSHLVDCGIQCTELQGKCLCEEMMGNMGPDRQQLFKYAEGKKANHGQADGFSMKGRVQKNQKRHNWKSRGYAGQYSDQHEAYNGSYSKPGKPQGGNGRNRY